jgi:hypothetical protein
MTSVSFPEKFKYKIVEKDPKRIESFEFNSKVFEIMHTGGFLRLYTTQGRVYWLAQNEFQHYTPDWKIHFSIELEQLAEAWNILGELFIEFGMDTGMKVIMRPLDAWPENMKGREITVYMYVHQEKYQLLEYGDLSKFLDPKFEREKIIE